MPAYDKTLSSHGTFSDNDYTSTKTKQVPKELATDAAEFLHQLGEQLRDGLSVTLKEDSLIFGDISHTYIGKLCCVLTQEELPSNAVSGKVGNIFWYVYNDEWKKLIEYSANPQKTETILSDLNPH